MQQCPITKGNCIAFPRMPNQENSSKRKQRLSPNHLILPELQGVSLQDPKDMWLWQLLFLPNLHPQNVHKCPYSYYLWSFWVLELSVESVPNKIKWTECHNIMINNLQTKSVFTNLFILLIRIEIDGRIWKTVSNRNQISFPESSKSLFTNNSWGFTPYASFSHGRNIRVHTLYLKR